jgi:hypothetical protein
MELIVMLLFFGLTVLCINKHDDWGNWALILWLIGNVIMYSIVDSPAITARPDLEWPR